MLYIVEVDEISDSSRISIPWKKSGGGFSWNFTRDGEFHTVRVACGSVLLMSAMHGRIGMASTSSELVSYMWRLGVPSICVEKLDDCEDAAVYIAERVVQHLRPLPTIEGTAIQFRAYCKNNDGEIISPWEWDRETKAKCPHTKKWPAKVTCDDIFCHHGFHHAPNPWSVTVLSEGHMLVTAPFGWVIQHERGVRSLMYDVCSIIVGLDEDVPNDPRIVRARNLPLKAWRVAQELLPFQNTEQDRELERCRTFPMDTVFTGQSICG